MDRCGIDNTPIVEQDQDPLVGTQLDRYEILEPLGRGAMGCVYRARHARLHSECAIKVLYGNFALNERLTARFEREAHAVNQMSHPNIVNVVDFGTSSGLTFLAMELVNGRTLEDALDAESPFTPERAANIARQLASGLGEAHRRGFVHRDLKPPNIMLASGAIETVKILDFGVVGMIQAAQAAKLTVAGHIVGTPTYMAPEQARGAKASPAADLYALGVIIFEMLAGHPPFEAPGVAEMLLQHIEQPPPQLPPSKGLEKIAMSLLEKEPERRPTGAGRVVAEIDRLGLGAMKTEQILVTNVLGTPPLPDAPREEFADTLDADTESSRSGMRVTRPPDPKIQDHDRTDPVPVASSSSALVAPSLPPEVDITPVNTSALDALTQLDFRSTRPPIATPELISTSSTDTDPPEDEEKDTADVPKREVQNAVAGLAEHDSAQFVKPVLDESFIRTVRDTPSNELYRPPPVIVPSSPPIEPPKRTALVVLGIIVAAMLGAMTAYALWRTIAV